MSQQINLFDPAYGPQRKPFSSRAMAWSLLVVVAAVAAVHGYVVQQTRSVERLLVDADARFKDQTDRTRALANDFGVDDGKMLADEITRAEARLAARKEVLREITTGVSANVEGYSGLMTALARSARTGLWLTGFSVTDRNAIEIRGRVVDAALVPGYMQSLNREPILQGRSVSSLSLAAKAASAPTPKPVPSAAAVPSRFVEFTLGLAARDTEQSSRGGSR